MVIDSPYYSVYEELVCPEQNGTGKALLYRCMAVTVCQKLLGYSNSPLIQVLRNWTGFCYTRVFVFTKVSTSPRVSSYLVKAYQIDLCCCKDWKAVFFDVATSFDSDVHRVHAVSFDAAVLDVASMIVAAGYIVSAGICDVAVVSAGSSSSVSAGYIIEFMLEDLEAVPAGLMFLWSRFISADRYRHLPDIIL
ncbi:hypothetical protein Tco_0054235 [Tanacetum coccineum]